jgi:hypothetical protein
MIQYTPKNRISLRFANPMNACDTNIAFDAMFERVRNRRHGRIQIDRTEPNSEDIGARGFVQFGHVKQLMMLKPGPVINLERGRRKNFAPADNLCGKVRMLEGEEKASLCGFFCLSSKADFSSASAPVSPQFCSI